MPLAVSRCKRLLQSRNRKRRIHQFIHEASPRSRFTERVSREAPDQNTANLLSSCCFILLGLRYDKEVIRTLFKGVRQMRESSTYQSILDEGRDEGLTRGRVEGLVSARQEDLLALLHERFGSVAPEIQAKVLANSDPIRLQAALRQVLRIASPNELPL